MNHNITLGLDIDNKIITSHFGMRHSQQNNMNGNIPRNTDFMAPLAFLECP